MAPVLKERLHRLCHVETRLEDEVGPIRVAISGKTKTPPLFPMLVALGQQRALSRLRDAIDLIAPGVA